MSEEIWIAHPQMPEKRPEKILKKQYYIWREAGWKVVEEPPPLPDPAEALDAEIEAEIEAAKKPAAKKPTAAKKK